MIGSLCRLRQWRRPWAVLLLALALGLGGAGSTYFAQAAPAGDYSKKIYLIVTTGGSLERTICVGDKVTVRASVAKVVQALDTTDPDDGGLQFAHLYGVPLEASVADPGIGSISPAAGVTSPDSDPLGQVWFTFTAKKAGTTTVKVDGKIITKELLGVALSSDTVNGELQLTVEECEYRVNATTVWRMEGDIVLVATITDAALVADGEGTYAGNADVQWVGSTAYPPPCWVIHHPKPSRAYLTGEMLGSDVLEVKVTYEETPALFSTMVCPANRGGPEMQRDMFENLKVGPESLRFWALTTGGSARRKPALAGQQILDSTAVIDVKPVPGG